MTIRFQREPTVGPRSRESNRSHATLESVAGFRTDHHPPPVPRISP